MRDGIAKPETDEHAGKTAEQGEHQAFGQHLSRDARAPAPSASRRLISRCACRGARQQQVRQIRAGNEQHEPDKRDQNEERLAELVAQIVHTAIAGREPQMRAIAARPCLEQGANDVAEGQVETALDLPLVHTRGKTPHDEHPPVIRIVEQGQTLAPSERKDHRLRLTGTNTSGSRPGVKPVNAGGFTPTMVTGTWLTRIVRPMADGRRPNRRAQNASLITATAAAAR